MPKAPSPEEQNSIRPPRAKLTKALDYIIATNDKTDLGIEKMAIN